ncbi:MAG: pilin [Candidatus Paceibacterota bacterium]
MLQKIHRRFPALAPTVLSLGAVCVVMVALVLPVGVSAQGAGDCRAAPSGGVLGGLVPCGCDTGTYRLDDSGGWNLESDSPDGIVNGPEQCKFNHFMVLIQNVITWIILFTIPVAAIMFSYAGYLLISAQGNESKITQGKQVFATVAIGFVFVLAAWLIVYTIASVLLDEGSGDPDDPNYLQFLNP